jgi:hypothetical protein
MKLLCCCLFLAAVAPAPGAPIPVFNTGLFGITSQDTHWSIIQAPAPFTTPFAAYVTDNAGFPLNGPWLPDNATSKWISPRPSYRSGQTDPEGTYIYRTTFSLDGLLPQTASMQVRVAVDNRLTSVQLNGGTVTGLNYIGFGSFSSYFTISSGFTAGLNTLDFITVNDAGGAGNPQGFRAEFINANAVPEPGPVILILSGLFFAGAGTLLRRARPTPSR